MNLGEAKKQLAMLINEYSVRGVKTAADSANVKDFYLKMPYYLDMAQKHIAETKHIKRHFKISHNLPFAPSGWNFATYEHKDADIKFAGAKVYAYSFRVDGLAEVFIELLHTDGSTTPLTSVTAYSDGGFKLFKDIIYIPDGVEYSGVQLRFAGDSYYNIKDIALYGAKYADYTQIPDFGRYIDYAMPKDFNIALRAEMRQAGEWEALSEFKWENPRTIAISAYVRGEVRIEYGATPETITDETPDCYEFEITTAAQSAMLLYAAAGLLRGDDYSQYQLLMQQYVEQMGNINEGSRIHQTKVTAKYKW